MSSHELIRGVSCLGKMPVSPFFKKFFQVGAYRCALPCLSLVGLVHTTKSIKSRPESIKFATHCAKYCEYEDLPSNAPGCEGSMYSELLSVASTCGLFMSKAGRPKSGGAHLRAILRPGSTTSGSSVGQSAYVTSSSGRAVLFITK